MGLSGISQNAPITTIASTQACPDSAIILPVTVTNFTGIGSISLRIDFDPTLLTYDSMTNPNASLYGILINVVTVNANLKKIMVVWFSIAPVTLTNGSKLFDLNFTYLNGNASLAFNNTSNGGSDCEYADEIGDPLNDTPTTTYYIDGQVTSNAIGAAGTISGSSTLCAGIQGVAYSVPAITNATGYTWTLPTGATIASGANTNSITVNFSSSASSGNITVYGSNSCGNGTVSPSFGVTVYPQPVPTITGPAAACVNSTGNTYSTETGMTGYTWNVTGGTISSGSGTNTITVTWNTVGAQSVGVNYTNSNGCTAAAATSYDVTVNPLPVPTITGPAAACVNSTENTYSTETGMTGYTWTVNGGAITAGGGASDSTAIVTWNTTGTQSVTVNYTNSNSCAAATATSYAVTVKPLPSITTSPLAHDQCSGVTTYISLSGSITGTTFSWTAASSSANIAGFSDGSGSIIAQTLTNSGYSTETVTYTITPSANGCTGPSSDYVVSVYPVPDLSNNPTTKSICSGVSTNITLLSNVSGTLFTWTATSSSPNISGYASNSTPSSTISQTLTNSGYTQETVTYHITPVANGCTGTSADYIVTVNPVPDLSNSPLLQSQCNNLATGISLTSNVSGTTFSWTTTGSSPNITGYSDGSGSSINQTLVNSGTGTETVTYHITPTANGCSGTTTGYVVSVYPTPQVTTSPTFDTICSGLVTNITLTSNVSGSSFSWSASATSPNLTGYAAGSGESITHTLINTGSGFDTVIYLITPSANSCGGPATNYYMTVHPLPSAAGTITGATLVLPNQTGVPYSITAILNATGYAWTLPTGASIASGTNTNSITVDYSASATSGNMSVHGTNTCGDGSESPILTIQVGYTIQGTFVYNNSAQTPLDSLWVTLKQNAIAIDSARTTLIGSYSFAGKPNGTYTLHAITQKPWSGVNGTDALKVQRHFVGLEILSTPIRITAADVNNSNSVNGTDALKVKRRFVGFDTSFARGNWTFEKITGGDTIIVNGAHVTQNFYGLCVGDVNGSNVPGTGEKSGGMVYSSPKGETTTQPGKEIFIPFMVSQDITIGAVSLTLEYPSEGFRIHSVHFSEGTPLFKAENGRMVLVWAETTPLQLKTGEILFTIAGTIQPDFVPGNVITFRAVAPSEIADATGESLGNVDLLSPTITYQNEVPDPTAVHLIEHVWIYPNPAGGEVFVDFNLLLPSELTIQIMDALGSIMSSSLFNLQKGIHHLKLSTETLFPGLYVVRFQASSGTLREIHFKKLIKN